MLSIGENSSPNIYCNMSSLERPSHGTRKFFAHGSNGASLLLVGCGVLGNWALINNMSTGRRWLTLLTPQGCGNPGTGQRAFDVSHSPRPQELTPSATRDCHPSVGYEHVFSRPWFKWEVRSMSVDTRLWTHRDVTFWSYCRC